MHQQPNLLVHSIKPAWGDAFTIVWPSPKLSSKMVHNEFLSTSTTIIASSPQSITITGNAQDKETALNHIVELNKGAGKK